MRSKDELRTLFTTYFGDRLSPAQIDLLVADVMVATGNQRLRTVTFSEVTDPGNATVTTLAR